MGYFLGSSPGDTKSVNESDVAETEKAKCSSFLLVFLGDGGE